LMARTAFTPGLDRKRSCIVAPTESALPTHLAINDMLKGSAAIEL
jgi:hypothetical protein